MVAALAAALLAAAPAASAVTPPRSPPFWRVDWGEPRCVLMREGGETGPSFAVRFVPADRRSEVWIIDPRWRASAFGDTGSIRLVLDPPAGEPVAKFVFLSVGTTGRHALAVENAGEDFLERLATAQAVSLQRKGVEVLHIALPGAATAVAGARQCEDDMLSRWGVDPAVFRALRQRPKPIGIERWLSSSDYPEEAVKQATMGTSVARVDVAADGKVTGCAIVLTSGSADLDRATCTAALRRGRFSPAVDPEGKRVKAFTIFPVRWQIFG
jgi:TonB family protein